jgi:hypothetical protein
MRIGLLLSPNLASSARQALAGEHDTRVLSSLADLRHVMRRNDQDGIVLDPTTVNGAELEHLRSMIAARRSMPLVIYTAPTAEALRACVALARATSYHLVVASDPNAEIRLRRSVRSFPADRFVHRFVHRLRWAIDRLPGPLRLQIERLFHTPRAIRGVAELSAASGIDARSIERWMDRVGLAAPKKVIIGAHMVWVCYYARETAIPTSEICRRIGIASPRTLRAQLQIAASTSLAVLRACPHPAMCLTRIETFISAR